MAKTQSKASKPESKPRAAIAQTPQNRRRFSPDVWIYLGLLLAAFAVYFQVRDFEFVNYDDDKFITGEPALQRGLTAEGIRWAFTSGAEEYWIPLTKISRLIDQELFGAQPGMHHLTNVVLHILAAWILFAFLNRATRARWSSAFVAFLFALHPLHVESVAWVTERKDVLSALFMFLTLWLYTQYAERPQSRLYLAALGAFSLSIMSKPMVVTVPCVLLLLDVWPLRRLLLPVSLRTERTAAMRPVVSWTRALAEKLPFLAVSVAAAAATVHLQRLAGAVTSENYPLGLRVANALVSYLVYIYKLFIPTNLAPFYRFPTDIPIWQSIPAALALLGMTFLTIRYFKRYPYLAIGWFWYLGTLAPVIGVFQQVGLQARADRYTYIPLVGLYTIVAWGLADLVARHGRAKRPVIAAVALACGTLWILTSQQISHWRNSGTLWSHALAVADPSYVAHGNLGMYFKEKGQFPEAIQEFSRSLELKPDDPKHRRELGAALTKVGRLEDSIRETREALKLNPRDAAAYNNLGVALSEMPGRGREAIAAYEQALRFEPDFLMAHSNLAVALSDYPDRLDDAIRHFETALRLKPDSPEIHYNLGAVLANVPGRRDEAISHFQTALRLSPGLIQAQRQLDLLLNNRNTP